MEAAIKGNQETVRVIEFKGRMATLNVIRINQNDLKLVNSQIEDKVNQAPDFFRHLPILLDLNSVPDIDLEATKEVFTRHKLTILGLVGGSQQQEKLAYQIGMPVLPAAVFGKDRKDNQQQVEKPKVVETQKDKAEEQPDANQTPTLVIKQPVRSGQQIYARGGDLIVLAAVGAGAEVLADGHIHIYGSLRGRALAGIQGDTQARIFCQSLDAELVSVAGSYMLSDDLPSGFVGGAVQISMVNDQLRIDSL